MPAHNETHGLAFRLTLTLILLASLLAHPAPALAGDGIVGTGTAASCTEVEFDTAFNAVQSSGGGTITFDCGAAPHTILFSAQHPVMADITLAGGGLITLSGGNSTSLFQVFSGQTFTLDGMVLSRSYGNTGAVENFGLLIVQNSQFSNNSAINSGGAITNQGDLTVSGSTFSENSAGQYGGGIFTDGGTVAITSTQFLSNTAVDGGGGIAATVVSTINILGGQFTGNKTTGVFAQGGAIYSEGELSLTGATLYQNSSSRGGGLSVMSGTAHVTMNRFLGNWGAYGGGIRQEGGDLTLTDVTLSGNGYTPNGTKVNTGGGGISWGNGTATLSNVTISGNWASYGGGFDHELGTTILTNVTLSGNSAVGGGGIDQGGGSISLTNVTVAGNSAPFNAGGIANRGGTLALSNTLLSGNYNPDNTQKWNCYGTIATSSFSLSDDFTCNLGNGQDGIPLSLKTLANNGGPTRTQLLAPGNPAIDAGTGANCPVTDQRGITRPQGAACDIGAVEMTPQDFFVRTFLPMVIH